MTRGTARVVRRALALVASLGVSIGQAAIARAQTPAPPATPPVVVTMGDDGIAMQSANGDYRLAFGLNVQVDGRFSLDDPAPFTDTFLLRKVRPALSGRLAKYFDFKVMPDFGNGTTTVADAWFEVRFTRAFRVRAGKDKTPIGYELLIGDPYVLFPERSLASSLLPNRDIGVQVFGDAGGGRLTYAGGVFNGIPDGASSTTDLDTNGSKDAAGRVTVQGLAGAGPLSGLGVQLGGLTGRQAGALPSFKTSAGQTYFSYASTATAAGVRTRVSPSVFYYYKAIGAYAEYVRSAQSVAKGGGDPVDVDNRAWDVTGSIVITGERATDRGVRTHRPFDPAAGHWGSVQLLARYSKLSVDPSAFSASLAAANASREAEQFTVGANWYAAPPIKYTVVFERTVFDGNASGPRPSERVILFLAQVAF